MRCIKIEMDVEYNGQSSDGAEGITTDGTLVPRNGYEDHVNGAH